MEEQEFRDRVTRVEQEVIAVRTESKRIDKSVSALDEKVTAKNLQLWDRANEDREKNHNANSEIMEFVRTSIDELKTARADDSKRQLTWVKTLAGTVLAGLLTAALIAFLK